MGFHFFENFQGAWGSEFWPLRCRVECRRSSQDTKPIATGWGGTFGLGCFFFWKPGGKGGVGRLEGFICFMFLCFFSWGGMMTCKPEDVC